MGLLYFHFIDGNQTTERSKGLAKAKQDQQNLVLVFFAVLFVHKKGKLPMNPSEKGVNNSFLFTYVEIHTIL